jgi:hypothetical protein
LRSAQRSYLVRLQLSSGVIRRTRFVNSEAMDSRQVTWIAPVGPPQARRASRGDGLGERLRHARSSQLRRRHHRWGGRRGPHRDTAPGPSRQRTAPTAKASRFNAPRAWQLLPRRLAFSATQCSLIPPATSRRITNAAAAECRLHSKRRPSGSRSSRSVSTRRARS